RFVMLSPQLLELLRDWRQVAQPRGWLFPGLDPVNPMSARQLCRAVSAAARAAGIAKRVSPHTLRHNAECRIIPSYLASIARFSVDFNGLDRR
ncbi:MAG TPA: tyrosine-type recombinase/integrase, partial [Vicinamibacterales bacterium]|nr:tyrosine-type recombinase/integrase [Vicinamibacterales bacterium]